MALGLCFNNKELAQYLIVAVLISFSAIFNLTAYVVVMFRLLRKFAPHSVQQRHLKRLAIYPLNFFLTYGLSILANSGGQNVAGVQLLPLSITCAGLNGLVNVIAYAWQSRHATALIHNLDANALNGEKIHSRQTSRSAGSFNVCLGTESVVSIEPATVDANLAASAEASDVEQGAIMSLENALVFREGGDILAERGDLRGALVEYRCCANNQQELLASDTSEYAATLLRIGDVLMLLGEFAAAVSEYEQVALIRKATCSEKSWEYAKGLQNVGKALLAARDFDQSLAMLCNAFTISTQLQDSDPLCHAAIAQNLGDALAGLGRFELAWARYEECNVIQQRILGDNSAECAALLHSKGKAWQLKGDGDKARGMFEQGVEILQASAIEQDGYPSTLLAQILRSFGDSLAEDNDLERSLIYYRQCRQIQKNSIGAEAFEYAVTEQKIHRVTSSKRQSARRSGRPSSNGGVSPRNNMLSEEVKNAFDFV